MTDYTLALHLSAHLGMGAAISGLTETTFQIFGLTRTYPFWCHTVSTFTGCLTGFIKESNDQVFDNREFLSTCAGAFFGAHISW